MGKLGLCDIILSQYTKMKVEFEMVGFPQIQALVHFYSVIITLLLY